MPRIATPILVAVSVVVAAVATLICSSGSCYTALTPGRALGPCSSGKTLLVIAHPDDECMFFGPTVQRLQEDGRCLHLLCLSTGGTLLLLQRHSSVRQPLSC